MDMVRDTHHLPVETPYNPFIVPINIEVIESFMQRVVYQGVVDKVSAFYMKFPAQPWQTMFKDFINCVFQKKDVIQYPRFTKLIIADLIKKFPSIPQRINEDYHSIKDDILLEIQATDDYKEYKTVFVKVDVLMNQAQLVVSTQGTHMSTPRAHRTPTLTAASPQGKKRKKSAESYADKFAASMLHDDVDDSENKIEPRIHKEHSEVVNDKDEKKDDEMGSLENRTKKMQTPIPTTSRSLRINLSSDKTIVQELTDTVSPSTATTSKDPHKKKHISSKYNHLPGALLHGKVDQVLHEISEVPALISKEFDAHAPKIIEDLFKHYVQTNAIQVHPTNTTLNDTTSSTDLQQQLYLKMKFDLQDQANDPTLWDVLKHKFEKSSISNTSCRDDDFHSQHHVDHHEDNAPLKGEKRVKRYKASIQGI
ncbi:hypothetical protein Tco_1578043 [Tanacetum coccineum]